MQYYGAVDPDTDAAYIEHDGETVSDLRWSSNGIAVRYLDGTTVLVDEYARFTCGVISCQLHDLAGIRYGGWVTAKVARFG